MGYLGTLLGPGALTETYDVFRRATLGPLMIGSPFDLYDSNTGDNQKPFYCTICQDS